MNVIKILPITDIATERHNPSIEEYRKISIGDKTIIIRIPCNISVFVTNKCRYNCEWCINKDNKNKDELKDSQMMDSFSSFLQTLNKLNTKYKTQLFEITLTGGEPLLKPELFIEMIYKAHLFDIPIRTISTTGINMLKNVSICDLYRNKITKPLYKYMMDYNAIYNINISRHAIDPKDNAKIFGVDKEPLSIEDLGKLSEIFRLYHGELRASANIGAGTFSGIKNLSDISYYIQSLYTAGVRSFIFREIVGSEYSKKCMNEIVTDIQHSCTSIESFAIQDIMIDVYTFSTSYTDTPFLLKIYGENDIKLPDTYSGSFTDYLKESNITPSIILNPSMKDKKIYDYLIFRNGGLFTDFTSNELICNFLKG